MILTNCAACAAPLAHDAPTHCVRCGHDENCDEIASGGGAEQYHAEKKYEEAVADAVEECAEDTEGQTCYICLEAIHSSTGEGLVRGCSCRGAAGFAHVSCLARQAKILVEEAEERDLHGTAFDARFQRWHTCSLCEQEYHGVVRCALGWACWKTYVGRPEMDWPRQLAMTQLGNGLHVAERDEEALSVKEAELATLRRVGASEYSILVAQNNLANSYDALGRHEDALRMMRDAHSGLLRLNGEEHPHTLQIATNCAASLERLRRYEEARSLLRRTIPVARRVHGDSHISTLRMRKIYAKTLYYDRAATLDDLREAVATLEDTERIARRVFGSEHPLTEDIERDLRNARAALRFRETPPPPSSPSESA